MTRPRPVLNQLNLVARDFEKTVAFYRRLGVDVPDGHDSPADGTRHAELEFDSGLTLEFDNVGLARLYNAAWRRPEGSSRTLIYDTFWGARYAVVADPDGNDVGLMSPLDEGKRSWPPKPSPAP